MKSIMHDKKSRTCYLCMLINDDDSMKPVLEEHHCIHGTANRKLSEKYGLKVYLCPECHRLGEYSAHRNARVDMALKKMAQMEFEHHYVELDFIKIFGKNYI